MSERRKIGNKIKPKESESHNSTDLFPPVVRAAFKSVGALGPKLIGSLK